MRFINKHLEEIFLIPAFLGMVVILFLEVIFRYALHNSLTWSGEISRYLLIWISWISASYVITRGEHLKVSFLIDLLPEKGRKIFSIISITITGAFALVIAILGTQLAIDIFSLGQVSPSNRIPMWIIYLSIPIGCFLITFRYIQQLTKTLKS